MIEMQDTNSRALQANLLARSYPKVKAYLAAEEVLLAVSVRKPQLFAGVFTAAFGVLVGSQIAIHFLMASPAWALPTLLASILLVWVGLWFGILCKVEFVFLTDRRIAHQRANVFGRPRKSLVSIPLGEVKGVKLFKGTLLFRWNRDDLSGDIRIKKKRGAYTLPSVKDGESVFEIITTEMQRNKNQGGGTVISTVIDPKRDIPVRTEVDVIVVGGGPAGSSASIAAARLGAKTVLIERYGHLGGMATGGLVWMIHSMSDGTNSKQIMGIAQEWIDRLFELDGIHAPADDEIGSTDEAVLKRFGKMFFWPAGRLIYGGLFDTEFLKDILNKMTIEAGVDLYMHSLGTRPIMDGNSVKGVFFESKEGTQAILGKTIIDCTGDGDIFSAAGIQSTTEMSGNNRLDKQAMIFEFANVDIELNEKFIANNPEKFKALMDELGKKNGFTKYFKSIPQRPGTVHFNMFLEGYSLIDVKSLTAIEVDVRDRMMTTFKFYKEHIPGFENSYILITAPQIGARGSRRMLGEYTLSVKDAQSGEVFEDSVAQFPPMHGRIYPEHPHIFLPLRTLIPKDPVEGIMCAGRCFSSDETINEQYNTISHCISMGQAAGTTAALAAKYGKTVRTIDRKLIQKSLLEQNVPMPALKI